jgi:adenylosuccinate synthase
MQAHAVIGAGFGDEGKGLITDYLVHQGRPDLTMVVRFNGGAQAGHTVVTPQGKRHVFSHFGSGTLAGASTFLSEHFIVNPHLFCKEVGELVSVGCEEVTVIVDPRAIVTTPYDMFINRAVERQRAGSRHGSVGVGINETVERSGHTGFKLTVGDLWDEKRTLSMLRAIREHWVPQRLKALGICGLDPETEASFASRHVIPVFMDSVSAMRARVHQADAAMASRTAKRVIFEGAQGLLLDQNRLAFMPYLTRSNTGLQNVLPLCAEMGVDQLETVYVTRPYLTRHGAGPLPTEGVGCQMIIKTGDAETNKSHEFQGDFRTGMLDLDLAGSAIRGDIEKWGHHKFGMMLGMNFCLAVTCTDQIYNRLISYRCGGRIENEALGLFLSKTLPMEVGVRVNYISAGPTRVDVRRAEAVMTSRIAAI